mmetsp:Transcript_82828/g.155953  ORF Transcript_82828/g.155953 Transcript_82828/m.155953 type:complete len:340 (-) Transcript_82828:1302-2321(-)
MREHLPIALILDAVRRPRQIAALRAIHHEFSPSLQRDVCALLRTAFTQDAIVPDEVAQAHSLCHPACQVRFVAPSVAVDHVIMEGIDLFAIPLHHFHDAARRGREDGMLDARVVFRERGRAIVWWQELPAVKRLLVMLQKEWAGARGTCCSCKALCTCPTLAPLGVVVACTTPINTAPALRATAGVSCPRSAPAAASTHAEQGIVCQRIVVLLYPEGAGLVEEVPVCIIPNVIFCGCPVRFTGGTVAVYSDMINFVSWQCWLIEELAKVRHKLPANFITATQALRVCTIDARSALLVAAMADGPAPIWRHVNVEQQVGGFAGNATSQKLPVLIRPAQAA